MSTPRPKQCPSTYSSSSPSLRSATASAQSANPDVAVSEDGPRSRSGADTVRLVQLGEGHTELHLFSRMRPNPVQNSMIRRRIAKSYSCC